MGPHQGSPTPPEDGDCGLGTFVGTDSSGASAVGHGGKTGAYTTDLTVWPDEPIAVAVLSPEDVSRPLTSLVFRLHRAWTTS